MRLPRLTRRPSPPAAAARLLDPDDRVVSFADAPGGRTVLASTRGLWWPEQDSWRCIPWQVVDKVLWRDGTLSVTEAEVVDDLLLVDRTPVSVSLEVPRDLPPTIRRRVEANIAARQFVEFPGGAARLVARRIPGRDGLVWWARLEPGTPDDARVRAHLAAEIDRRRAEDATSIATDFA